MHTRDVHKCRADTGTTVEPIGFISTAGNDITIGNKLRLLVAIPRYIIDCIGVHLS